jgi:DNA polymerase-3 subunit epsilon
VLFIRGHVAFREHYQQRDRLRLIVDYRRKFLDSLVRGGEEAAELSRLWKKLVKLYYTDRFANQPDKLETYHKLTAASNRAKDAGDIQTLREIAEDPHGFILRQGWATLDFSHEAELAQLRRLHETLQLEITAVLESLNRLRESPDYELCQLSEHKPSVLGELAAERRKLLEKESAELAKQADKLAEEIKELGGEDAARIA